MRMKAAWSHRLIFFYRDLCLRYKVQPMCRVCTLELMADRTGLEPATSGVTGRHSNQLNYRSKTVEFFARNWWVVTGSNRRPSACKADALPAELTTPEPRTRIIEILALLSNLRRANWEKKAFC